MILLDVRRSQMVNRIKEVLRSSLAMIEEGREYECDYGLNAWAVELSMSSFSTFLLYLYIPFSSALASVGSIQHQSA